MRPVALRLLLVVSALLVATPAAGQVTGPAGFHAARDLQRGVTLTRDDYVGAGESGPVGWVTRRVVRAGEPLRPPAIVPARVIRSGDQVKVVWSDGALEVRLTGRAMNAAAAGEPVRVRVDARRRFEGTANEDGTVRLDPLEKRSNR